MDTYELTYSYLSRPFLLFLSLSRSYAPLPCRVQGNIGTSLYQSMSHSPRFPSSWFLLHRSYTRAQRYNLLLRSSWLPSNFWYQSTSRHVWILFSFFRTFVRTLDREFFSIMGRRKCNLIIECVILRCVWSTEIKVYESYVKFISMKEEEEGLTCEIQDEHLWHWNQIF